MHKLSYFIVLVSFGLFGQDYTPKKIDFKNVQLVAPLEIELILAGNFGEMRSNHFHTGLDIKTQHVEGKRVFSVEEGFISRVRISPWGYGKALYIEHPNGLTSVYAHLSRFPDKIEELIYQQQLKNESDIIDADVSLDSFYVKKGELIAYSGNSGSSSAPHLHFEIRETSTEHALNPLLFDCYRALIKDNRQPKVYGIKLYAIDEKGYMIPGRDLYFPCKPMGNKWVINDNNPIDLSKIFTENSFLAFGLHATDQLDAANNVCGIHNSFLMKDSVILAENKIDYINFENNRYLNSHKDYFEFKQNNHHIHKHFKTILNPLGTYPRQAKPIDWKTAEGNYSFRVLDIHKNEIIVNFSLAKTNSTPLSNPLKSTNKYYFPDSVNTFLNDDFQVLMESGTFYEPLQKLFRIDSTLDYLSVGYQFSEYAIPAQKYYDIRIKAKNIHENLPKHKLAIGTLNDNGYLSYVGGYFIDGWIEASVRNFGTFVLVVDSTPPKIQPLDFKEGQTITKYKTLELAISDDLSGIMHYKAYLNDEWVLMIYDRRKKRYIIPLDQHSKPNLNPGNNVLRLVSKDKKGNEATKQYTLNY